MCTKCEHAKVVGYDIRRMGREVGRLTVQLAPLTKAYHAALHSHPKCAACGILVGEDHAEQQLTPEPIKPRAKGQRRYDVCSSCFERLFRAKRSVPEQRAYDREITAELGQGEDEE